MKWKGLKRTSPAKVMIKSSVCSDKPITCPIILGIRRICHDKFFLMYLLKAFYSNIKNWNDFTHIMNLIFFLSKTLVFAWTVTGILTTFIQLKIQIQNVSLFLSIFSLFENLIFLLKFQNNDIHFFNFCFWNGSRICFTKFV